MPKLTKSLVEAIEPEEAGPVYAWDSRLAGFGVKVLPTGRRSYVVKYRAGGGGRAAPQRWATLGRHGALTCEQAREMARQVLASVARGEDPQAVKLGGRAAAARMADLWQRFAAEQLPLKKPSTARDYRSAWSGCIAPVLGKRPIRDVTRRG